jgi:GxxExxY protein
MLDIDQVTGEIVDAAYQIHRRIGPGLFEMVYEELLANALRARGLKVERQKPIPLVIDGVHFDRAFRADLLVDDRVIVELKSLERLPRFCARQLLTYLRLLDLRVGLVINFGAETLAAGIQRVVNDHMPSPSSPFSAKLQRR